MISRRHLRIAVALLLPLLALRALLPAGYMVANAAGELRIVMCSTGLAAWGAPAPAMPGDHDKPLPDHGDDCPFAHSSMQAPPPYLVHSADAPVPVFLFPSNPSDHIPPATGPPRQHGARAPPVSPHHSLA